MLRTIRVWMVLDMHVLDRHCGDIHVPPSVPASGAVPGMDPPETCVRSMDAPDDQMDAPETCVRSMDAPDDRCSGRSGRGSLTVGDLRAGAVGPELEITLDFPKIFFVPTLNQEGYVRAAVEIPRRGSSVAS